MKRIIYKKMKQMLVLITIIMLISQTIPIKVLGTMTTEEIETEATEMAEIFTNVSSTYSQFAALANVEDCRALIEDFVSEKENEENKIYCNDGKVYIEAISTGDIERIFSYHIEPVVAASIPYVIEGHDWYEFIVVKIVTPNTIPAEGEEDTRTPEQKIKDWIIIKYPNFDSSYIDVMLEDNARKITYHDGSEKIKTMEDYMADGYNIKYSATFDEEENVIEVIMGIEYLRSAGVSDNVVDSVNNEQKEEDSADAGGLLLELLVPLVNFIADAIVASVGTIMNGQGLSFGMDILVPEAKKWQVPADVTEFTDVSTNSFVVGGMQYPNITYTPEEIFAGKIDLLSIDFISGKNFQGMQNTNSDWNGIRATISQWYQVLRLVAIIGLLSVLIYTGIKIILSATAKDKAKYKEWIMNWFMAVAILFSMHFIMAFIIAVTGEISQLITNVSQNIYVKTSGGETFATNLMGLVRFMVQSDNFYMKVGYEVMYIALIVYTIKFTFVYLKRVLSMAFLTLIAPIVALTYPIDKVNDGKAQGFDMWLKEYTFNALLQPMHCILYYVLVGSAVGIAASNPIYGIVVLAFMTEAEKLLKSIFGFSKAGAGTVGGVGSAFAAGAIASNIAKMAKFPKGNAGKGGSGSSGGDDKTLEAPKPTQKPGMDVFDDGGATDDLPENPQNSDLERERQNVASERDVLDEFEAEGASSNNWTDEDYEAYQQLEQEQLEREEQLRQREQAGQQGSQSNGSTDGASENTEGGNGNEQGPSNGDSGSPVREMAAAREEQRQQNKEKGKFAKGAGAVWKKIHKPIWDSDKSASYNWKRLGKGALKGTAKAVGGFALGATAAAVQAGISITDGKYNPMEGIAAVTAGFAGAGGIVDRVGSGIGSMIDTYRDGTLPDNPTERNKEIMRRSQERFANRDDVIAFNKKNYPGKEDDAMKRQRDNYLTAGVTDLNEMKSGMKYADSLVGKTDGLSAEQIKARRDNADKQAAATINFEKALRDQGQFEAIRNKQKQQSYIDTMVSQAADADKARVRRQYENAFKSVAAYHNTKA